MTDARGCIANVRRWTPDEVAFLCRAYGRITYAEMGRSLGRSECCVNVKVSRLRRKGLIGGPPGNVRHQWTAEEIRFARRLQQQYGFSAAEAAAKVGSTPSALTSAAERRRMMAGTSRHAPGTLTMATATAALGVDRKWIVRWIDQGLLTAYPERKTGKGRVWKIFPADLLAFLEAHPAAYDYDRIPATVAGRPNPWKAHARPAHPTAGYLPAKVAARRAGMSVESIRYYCKRGVLTHKRIHRPGVHRRELWVLEADLLPLKVPEGLSVRAVAAALGWSAGRVLGFIERGELPATRRYALGRPYGYVVPREAAEAFIKHQRSQP